MDRHWRLASGGLPFEHDSIFAKYAGTEKWNKSMFRRSSDRVLITVEFENGTRLVTVGCTRDGEWKTDLFAPHKVIAWMYFPEPCMGI